MNTFVLLLVALIVTLVALFGPQTVIRAAMWPVHCYIQKFLVCGMTTLAADTARAYMLGEVAEYPVIASDIIYEGAAVGENGSGYARPLVAADPFLGFAESKVDNAAGAAGDKTVRVKNRGKIQLAIAAVAITANDRPKVYASDDNTFTLTAGSNTLIGTVYQWVSTGIAIVEFDALQGL